MAAPALTKVLSRLQQPTASQARYGSSTAGRAESWARQIQQAVFRAGRKPIIVRVRVSSGIMRADLIGLIGKLETRKKSNLVGRKSFVLLVFAVSASYILLKCSIFLDTLSKNRWNVHLEPVQFRERTIQTNISVKEPANSEIRVQSDFAKNVQNEKGKVAFMFLMGEAFEASEIWRKYLTQSPAEQWSVYIHIDPSKSAQSLPSFYHEYVLSENKRKQTVYCFDLVSATIALISEALLDISNEKFVLLSPTHIPVKPFPCLRRLLFQDGDSWLCLTPTSQWASVTPGEERPKHHQWVILSRHEAERQAQLPHAPTSYTHGCHDEYLVYPPTIPLSEDSLRRTGGRPWPGLNGGFLRTRSGSNSSEPLLVESGRCSTYVYWADYRAESLFKAVAPFWEDTQADAFHFLDPISYCLLRGFKDRTDFLFARKVAAGARVSRRCLGPPAEGDLSVVAALAELGVLAPP